MKNFFDADSRARLQTAARRGRDRRRAPPPSAIWRTSPTGSAAPCGCLRPRAACSAMTRRTRCSRAITASRTRFPNTCDAPTRGSRDTSACCLSVAADDRRLDRSAVGDRTHSRYRQSRASGARESPRASRTASSTRCRSITWSRRPIPCTCGRATPVSPKRSGRCSLRRSSSRCARRATAIRRGCWTRWAWT